MLITVDIGNSNIGIGLFRDAARNESLLVRTVPSRPARTAAFYSRIIDRMLKEAHSEHSIIPSVVASVVPARDNVISDALFPLCKRRPLFVGARTDCGLTFNVNEPLRLGADRIANAVAGVNLNNGRPTAVLDFGTATTLTVVGNELTFLGGAILPGLSLMLKALHSGTAKLPLVTLDAAGDALGTDTGSSIVSGVIYGTAGAAEKLIKVIEKELRYKLQLVLTGGNAPLISSFISRPFTLLPHLTHEGMRLIYLKNRQKAKG